MYPFLQKGSQKRQTVDKFGGLNTRNPALGEFLTMENLTAEAYPYLSPRQRRGIYREDARPTAMIAKDCLCYTEGSRFAVGGYEVDLGLSKGEKQLVSMGAYVVILPDKKYINTIHLEDHGSLESIFEDTAIHICLCDETGAPLGEPTVSDREVTGSHGALWMDTATGQLMQFSGATESWVPVSRPLLRLQAAGLGRYFAPGDGVFLENFTLQQPVTLDGTGVIQAVGEDFVVLPGLVHRSETAAGRIARRVPDMDFVTQCGNRLWGCKFGMEGARAVNQIYGCKLGDFKNWYCYAGLSTDSFAASVGSDGPFTAAATHLGHPVFFKENCIHKVYISAEGAHKLQDTPAPGVAKGSHNSLAEINAQLLYLSRDGFCAYDGSLPVPVGRQLGQYDTAVAAAALGSRYYVSAIAGQQRDLLVWDGEKGMWHREDGLPVTALCACRGDVYAAAGGQILTLRGSGETGETAVKWMAETGVIGIAGHGNRFLHRLEARVWLAPGSRMRLRIRYDEEDPWRDVCHVTGKGGAVCLPVRPHRCSRYQLQLLGEGDARVFALHQIVEQGGDGP